MDKRKRIKDIIAEMQKGGPNVNQLVKEMVELKRSLGDPVPSINPSKLSGSWKLERKGIKKIKRKPRKKSRKKSSE